MKKTSRIIYAMLLLCSSTLNAELIGYWSFDDDTCMDNSGNAYHGTMNGGSYSTDVPAALAGGKSIDLTGIGQYVIGHL